MMYRVVLTILMLCGYACSQEAPRVYLNTGFKAAVGASRTAATSSAVQLAINQSVAGDEVVISGSVTGNFTLPAHSGTGEVIIRGSLSAEGQRVSPLSVMAKVISPNADPVFLALANSAGWRLVDLEITVIPGWAKNGGLVIIGSDTETNLAASPSGITIDRCWIHGNTTGDVTRGVTVNGRAVAVIDSYINEIHGVGYDTQAICGWNGAGPFKFVNNYLEAAGENIMFGGADAKIANLVPSDIEIQRNWVAKPYKWKIGDPAYAGIHWSIKNLFELKNAQRVLINGNVFEGSWVDGQVGFAVQFTVRNQDGANPWAIVADAMFSNNIVRHAAGGVNVLGKDDRVSNPSQQGTRIAVVNNLFDDIGGASWPGNGRLFQTTSMVGLIINHNTALNYGDHVLVSYGVPTTGLVYTNNVSAHGAYGVFGDASSTGNATLAKYFPGAVFQKNALAGGNSALYPTGNFFPANLDTVGFVSRTGSNYRLAAGTPYKSAGTDGKDVGADIDAINAAIAGSVTPVPPPIPPPVPPTPVYTITVPVTGLELVIRDPATGKVLYTIKLNP